MVIDYVDPNLNNNYRRLQPGSQTIYAIDLILCHHSCVEAVSRNASTLPALEKSALTTPTLGINAAVEIGILSVL